MATLVRNLTTQLVVILLASLAVQAQAEQVIVIVCPSPISAVPLVSRQTWGQV